MSLGEQFYCRLCALLIPRNKLKDLLLDEENYSFLEKLIRINAAIDSFDDTLPKMVCFNCIRLLDQAFDFVLQVGRAQKRLRDKLHLQNVKTEDEVSDVDYCGNKYEEIYAKVKVTTENEESYIDDCGNDFLSNQEVSSEVEIGDKVLDNDNDFVSNKQVCIAKELKAVGNVPEVVDDCGNEFVSNEEVSIAKEEKADHYALEVNDCGNEFVCNEELSIVKEEKTDDNVLELDDCGNEVLSNEGFSIENEEKTDDNVPELDYCGNGFVSTKEVCIAKEEKADEVFPEVYYYEFLSTKQDPLKEEIITEAVEVTPMPLLNENPVKTETLNITTESELRRKTKVANSKAGSSLDMSLSCSTWCSFTWLCAICDTQFINLKSLQEHSLSHHNTCNSYRCIGCHKRKFNIDKFVTHICTHIKHLRLSCYQCSESFRNVTLLKKHRTSHITSDFVCRGCNMCFKSEEELTQHREKYYRATSKIRIIPEKLKQNSLTCRICGKTSSSKTTQVSHLLTHTDRSRNHICEVCGKPFLRKYDLDRHMFTHNKGLFQCTICQSRFNTIESLRNHKGIHDNIKPFSCKICGKKFRLQAQVNFHQVVHSSSYPFKCEVCGKGFNYKHRLQEHAHKHTGAMPYSCDICNKSFRDRSNVSKHMKKMHNKISKRKTNVIKESIKTDESRQRKRKKVK